MTEQPSVSELRKQLAALQLENAHLRDRLAAQERWIVQLREAVDALMQPSLSELLAKNRAHPSRR